MTQFNVQDPARNRRLLIVFGCLLIIAGLLAGLFDRSPPERKGDTEDREEAMHIEAVLDTGLEDEGASAAEEQEKRSEFEARVAAVDRSAAPAPIPAQSEVDGVDLYSGVTVEFLSFFFDAIGYTRDAAEAGETRFVPPVFLLSIPADWAEEHTVQLKKSLFYRTVLPIVLLENRRIRIARDHIERFARLQRNRAPIPRDLRDAVKALAVAYGLRDADTPAPLDSATVNGLLLRVDIVPPSLALAQAAYESGYGTSRFAVEGNALFGQWAWGDSALAPKEQRTELGDYGIRAFETPGDSVRAYLHNLNTHRAYDEFRSERARQRAAADDTAPPFDSIALAGTLLAYSERGEAYTADLQGMIRHNRLQDADRVQLLRGEPVLFR